MERKTVGVRLGVEGLTVINQIAEDSGATLSTTIRVMLGEALRSKDVKTATIDRLNAMKETL